MRGVSRWLRGVAATALLLSTVLPASAAEKVVVATDFAPHGMTAGLQLAKQKGWFEAAGLDVDVQDGKGSNNTIQLVAAGQLDIGFAQLSAMAAGVSNGIPVTSVIGFVQSGDNGLLFPASTGWTKMQDLKGKKIAAPAGAATAVFIDPFLKAGGITRNDVIVLSVDSSALASTYTSGAADAVISTLAYFAPIVAKVRPSNSILFSDVGLAVPSYGLVVRKDQIDKRTDMIKKFVEVQQKTWVYIFNGHQQEAVDAIVAQRVNMRLDPDVLMGQLVGYMKLFNTAATKGHPMGWQAESDWVSTLKAMGDVGMVKPEIKPADVYTNRFISPDYTLPN